MSKPESPKYRMTNWKAHNAALKSPGALMIWLDPTIQFCLTIKGLFGLALRQTTGMVESLFRLAHLDWKVPDFSTISRRQKTLKVIIPTRKNAQYRKENTAAGKS